MKREESIDKIIQVNNVNIGKIIAMLRKASHLKQTDMVAKLQTKGIDISIYSYNRIEKAHRTRQYRFCMPVAIFSIVT